MAGESAAGRVTRDLRQRMLSGELRPGTRLSQHRLAQEYDVSRMPARDALQALASEGLVDVSATTAVVRRLSVAELQELYELREAVEPLLTRLAVPNVGRAELTQMKVLLERMESGVAPVQWLECNTEFHALVYTRGNRPRMIQITEQLRRLTDRYLYLHVGVFGDMGHLHEEHRGIYEAVSRGDANAAADLTRAHLATSHEFILRFLLDSEHSSLEPEIDHTDRSFGIVGAGGLLG
ncbi:GntR family transcriptional regulator [Mycolicibacterium sp. P9-64]|uniref:GntR family transcriptional regulator n=1 Tax=Mycolicibacterium sp. P9-64 TaxID=2024612 RepID=UPI0011EFBB88|nr:GntR family transcriptional regulator [Mycolicibacterium sp. P9-64]KAA0083318.1 GntR family transcriptional regulator [Mycolicibacterium sp. P9-64]